MKPTATKLAALRDKQAKLQARIDRLENRNKQQERKDDAHLKILIGATLLADATAHPETDSLIRTILARGKLTDRHREFLQGQGWL